MKFTTIWTLPAMTLTERFRRTGEWLAQQAASALPQRVRYWAFIQTGGGAIRNDEVVTDVRFMEVLERL